MASLRVIDFGTRSPLRSQTLWHAIAHAASEPTLSFVRPSAPYVSIGFHRRLEEIDPACGLPVFRREIGGGTVICDPGQLFFQIRMAVSEVPSGGPRAMRWLLDPAVAAFRDAGVDARFDETGDISVGDAKICGIGGGQIGSSAIAVGNLIERFDHEAMARVLAVDDDMRADALRLMRRFVVATPIDAGTFIRCLRDRCAQAFGLDAYEGDLDPSELDAMRRLDAQFLDEDWLHGPDRPAPRCRQVKVRAGVWVFCSAEPPTRVAGAVVFDRIERIRVSDPSLNGDAARLEGALRGVGLDDVTAAAAGFGEAGRRVAQAIALTRRTL